DPARAAETKSLMLEQFVDHRNGFLVLDQISLVDFHILDDRSYAAEPDAFGDRAARRRFYFAVLVQIVHGGATGIGDADHDVFLLLAQECAGAGKRAAGAHRADEPVDLAERLFPDFRA